MASTYYTAPTLSADGETADAADINEINNATLAAFELIEADWPSDVSVTQRGFSVSLVASDTDVAVADGTSGFCVPETLDGMNIVDCVASVYTAGTTGTTDIQIRRSRAGADVDVLSTKLTIDSAEVSSITAAAPFVINTSNDDLAEGDILFVDIDAISTTTAPKGLFVTVMAELP
jgi:hypothetical protein